MPRVGAAAFGAWLLAACGAAQLVTVPSGPQPAKAQPVAVDYPPPPAKIEEIPLSRRSGNRCVWRDGFWDWTGRRWEWQGGRAVLSPAGCRFAESKLVDHGFALVLSPCVVPRPRAETSPQRLPRSRLHSSDWQRDARAGVTASAAPRFRVPQ